MPVGRTNRREFIAALGGAAAMALALVGQVRAQDLMRYLDLSNLARHDIG